MKTFRNENDNGSLFYLWTVANWTLTTLFKECPWYTGTTDETGRTGRAGQALANLG
jgi:hypothetical protein